jgi:Cadherin-like domain/Bacterial Ig domain/Dockerin type I domain
MTIWQGSWKARTNRRNRPQFRRLCGEALELRAMLTAPVAANDYLEMLQDSSLVIEPAALLANDSDADQDSLQAALALSRGPYAGTLTINGDGTLLYKPNPGYYGNDYFNYYASDGTGYSKQSASVEINVKETPPSFSSGIIIHDIMPHRRCYSDAIFFTDGTTNPGPVAISDCFKSAEDTRLTIEAQGIFRNDRSGDGSPLVAALHTPPAHGTANLNADGSFTYSPTQDYFGWDEFVYRLTNGSEIASLGTVYIEITPVNDAPVVHDDLFTTESGLTLTILVSDLLANDRDVDNKWFSAVLPIANAPKHGSLAIADTRLIFTPDLGYLGSDEFEYVATDGQDFSASLAIVAISLTAPVRHNRLLAADVNNDSHVSPADALLIINCLNSIGAGPVSRAANYGRELLDVNGDGTVAAIDVLMVINALNARASGGQAQPAVAALENVSAIDAVEAAHDAVEAAHNAVVAPPDELTALVMNLLASSGRRRSSA